MAALRFSHQDESQVDPFTAGEPELPGGEPDRLDEAPDELPGTRPDYAPHGDPTGQPHKPDDNYQAPTTRSHAYDAPSTDEPSAPRRRRRARSTRPAPGQADEVRERTRRDRHVATTVILALVLLVSFGSSIVSCAAGFLGAAAEDVGEAVEGLGDTLFDDEETNVPDQGLSTLDPDDQAALDALSARVEGLLATPESGALHDRVAAYLDDELRSDFGRGTDELGIDAGALATWLLSRASYTPDVAFTYSDGTGSVYAYLTAPDAYDLASDVEDAVWDYLIDEGLMTWDDEPAAALTDSQRARVAELAQGALQEEPELDESSVWADVELIDGSWRIADEEELVEELSRCLGVW